MARQVLPASLLVTAQARSEMGEKKRNPCNQRTSNEGESIERTGLLCYVAFGVT